MEKVTYLERNNTRNMQKILSIVIPTFNMEKYLPKCLDSLILSSNMDKLEILVINDGSKDSSSLIAHNYEKKYPNTFKVIDKDNGNYGSCVNVGLGIATGKYFRILDADDWFDNFQFTLFLNELINLDVDVVFTNYTLRRTNKRPKEISVGTFKHKKIYEIDKWDFSAKKYSNMLVMHAITYKTTLLRAINYKQQTGISYTDIEYCYFPLCRARQFAKLNLNLYQYRIGREGQTMQINNMVKNIEHFYMVATRVLDDYYTNCNNLKFRRHALFHIMSNPIYQIYLINLVLLKEPQKCHIEFLYGIEHFIKRDKELYKFIDSYTYRKIPFVHIWHLFNFRIGIFIGR